MDHPAGERPAAHGLMRLLGVAVLVCAFGAVMSVVLTRAKLQQGISQIVEARVLASGRELARSIERVQGLGLDLGELETLPTLLQRYRAADPLISDIEVFDPQGRVIASSLDAAMGQPVAAAIRHAAEHATTDSWAAGGDHGRVAGVTLRTGYGLVIGHLGLNYADDELARAMERADRSLLPRAALYFAVAGAVSGLLVAILSRRRRMVGGSLAGWSLAAACLVPLLAAMAAFGLAAREAFAQELIPHAERKAEMLGRGLAGLFDQATGLGFDFRQLYGVEAALSELRDRNPEVASVAAADADGRVVYAAGPPVPGPGPGRVVVPLERNGKRYGALLFGIDPAFVHGLIADMAIDVAVVLIVALVLAGELVRQAPTGAVEGDALGRLRAPVFGFMLAEELTRPCLPGFIGSVAEQGGYSAQPLLVGLPIALFMLIVALGLPGLGRWSERVGRRRALVWGALVAALGFLGTASCAGLPALVAWRALCAVGYALVFAAGQGYVLDHSGSAGRTRGFAVFVGAIMAATVCGPSIGGILADQFGPRTTFGVSAALCLLALVPMRGLPAAAGRPPAAVRGAALASLASLLSNRKFAGLALGAAIPAKVLLIGVLFYLVPLYVAQLGYGQAMAGRLIMIYGLLMVLLVPFAASHGERSERRRALVVAGLGLSGAGVLAVAALPQVAGLVALAGLLGLGQALSISAQAALVGELSGEQIARHGEDAIYGAYRLLERLGNAAGPLIAGALLAASGFAGAFAALGLAAMGSALALWWWLGRREPLLGGVRHALR